MLPPAAKTPAADFDIFDGAMGLSSLETFGNDCDMIQVTI